LSRKPNESLEKGLAFGVRQLPTALKGAACSNGGSLYPGILRRLKGGENDLPGMSAPKESKSAVNFLIRGAAAYDYLLFVSSDPRYGTASHPNPGFLVIRKRSDLQRPNLFQRPWLSAALSVGPNCWNVFCVCRCDTWTKQILRASVPIFAIW
jgi:hypothetical protein